MADKIVVMNNGRVEQAGTPLDLYDEPKNTFVAGFIGSPSMNMIEGKIVMNGKPEFVGAEGLKIPLPNLTGFPQDGSVVLGIRPEHFKMSEHGVEAEVRVVEPTGSETHVLARLCNEDIFVVLRERHRTSPGDKIRLLPLPGHLHIFDSKTGSRALH